MNRRDELVLKLTEAMVGAISPNMRLVSLELRKPPRVRLHFVLEGESAEDREACNEIALELAESSHQDLEVEVNVVVSTKPVAQLEPPGRVVYGRKEDPTAAERSRIAPILRVLSRWGVEDPLRVAERRPFQSWLGKASSWSGRLANGRAVAIEVQDSWAEPRLEHGGPTALDLREQADALVREVNRAQTSLHPSLVPWLRVEHEASGNILVWMRESQEGERIGIPSGVASPDSLCKWLRPVADAVDWATDRWSFGLCPGPEDLVWRGARVAVGGWGKESFDRLVTSRNGELRLGLDPEISAALREKRALLPNAGWLSPNAEMSVPGFVGLWLRLRLGKEQVWFEHQLDPLPAAERGVMMKWLTSRQAPGSAVDFLRELGRALA